MATLSASVDYVLSMLINHFIVQLPFRPKTAGTATAKPIVDELTTDAIQCMADEGVTTIGSHEIRTAVETTILNELWLSAHKVSGQSIAMMSFTQDEDGDA